MNVSAPCQGGGIIPYPGPFCLLFSCCDHGCGWASSLRAVAYPSLTWSVFPPVLAPTACPPSVFSVHSLPLPSFLVLAWKSLPHLISVPSLSISTTGNSVTRSRVCLQQEQGSQGQNPTVLCHDQSRHCTRCLIKHHVCCTPIKFCFLSSKGSGGEVMCPHRTQGVGGNRKVFSGMWHACQWNEAYVMDIHVSAWHAQQWHGAACPRYAPAALDISLRCCPCCMLSCSATIWAASPLSALLYSPLFSN